jgi:hypothetical protein
MQLTFLTNTRWISNSSRIYRNENSGGYNKSSLPLINKEDYEILYGLILGDLYISTFGLSCQDLQGGGRRKNTENAVHLKFEQSIINKDYLELHLFNKFKYLCTKNMLVRTAERKVFNTGWRSKRSMLCIYSSVYFCYSAINSYNRTPYFILSWR